MHNVFLPVLKKVQHLKLSPSITSVLFPQWFQPYFKQIRPENIRPENVCNNFVSSTGEAVQSVSQDMHHLHEMYVPT